MKLSKLVDELDETVRTAMEDIGVPGVSIGMVLDGEEVLRGYGVTNVEFPMTVDGDTVFLIGSTTKTFTATALMQLVDDGAVDLEAPVRRYLPKFSLPDRDVTEALLVRHLVTHTGGFLGDFFEDRGRGSDALRRIVARLGTKAPQMAPLGSVWSYNNAGFYVLGRIIEVVSGKEYEAFVAERILEPLGMGATSFFAEDAITRKVAAGHNPTADGGLEVVRPWGLSRGLDPAGGIASTARDQMRYARFHLGDGTTADGAKLLSASALKRMQEPLAPAGAMADAVGVSWLLDELPGARVVKHGGSIGGHMSAFAMVPARGFAITVLTNSHWGHRLDERVVAWALQRVLHVRRAKPPAWAADPALVAEVAGVYGGGAVTYEVSPAKGGMLTMTTRAPEELAHMYPPPVRLRLTGPDRIIALDAPVEGRRGEFVRRQDGTIGWFRWGGRAAPRQ